MYRKIDAVDKINLSLRDAWSGHVTPEDYEQHMSAIGQAQANASLVRTAILKQTQPGANVRIAGAGTGQMFDYEHPGFLAPFQVTFSDINPEFLRHLERRLAGAQLAGWRTTIDDLENTRLAGPFDLLVVVLVFEHIDWRKGVASISLLAPRRCVIVIQQNPPGMSAAVSPTRTPPGTMKVFVEVKPVLIAAEELIAEMAAHAYRQLETLYSDVADGKKMCAILFENTAY